MVEITLNGPGKNALGSQMMDYILQELQRAKGAPVLITGAGDAFSAGLNLKEVAALGEGEMEGFVRKLEALYSALFTYPGPTAAAVNGHAIAGGCLVTLACDIRICSPDPKIRIGLNEIALGLQLPPGMMRMVRTVISPDRLSEVLLGAGLHPPEDALRLGFVDALAEDPVAVARERLAAWAKHPSDAYALAKRSVRGTTTLLHEDEAALQEALRLWKSPALKERIAAMFAKK